MRYLWRCVRMGWWAGGLRHRYYRQHGRPLDRAQTFYLLKELVGRYGGYDARTGRRADTLRDVTS